MRPLNSQQASRCENSTTPRCRCRCHGRMHGAGRGEVVALPRDDPHAVDLPADLELAGVQLALPGLETPRTPADHLQAARAALSAAVAAYQARDRVVAAEQASRRPAGRVGASQRIGA